MGTQTPTNYQHRIDKGVLYPTEKDTAASVVMRYTSRGQDA
ncbi:hypothetical protein [Okeania sp. SIO3B5]|nr:hypothetical protein [Okeania sp. SIO3B5]